MFNTVVLALVAISASAIHITENKLNQNVAKENNENIAQKQAPGQQVAKEDMKGEGNQQDQDARFVNIFKEGACPKVELMKDIEFVKLAGDWFLHADTCPISRMIKPECNHSVLDIKEDGTFRSAKELSIMKHRMQIHDVTGTLAGDQTGVDIAGKLHIGMNLLDTDYEQYAVFYQCFENISKISEDKTLKPVHVEMVAIASRDANWKDEEFTKV